MRKKNWPIFICNNILCGREFRKEKWRNPKYCCHACSTNDPNSHVKVTKRSLQNRLIDKYGRDIGEQIFNEVKCKQSVKRKQYLESLTRDEVKKLCTAKNLTKGRKMMDMLTEKYGEIGAVEKYKDMLSKISKALSNKTRPHEVNAKIRLAKIQRIEKLIKNKISPRYNPNACRIIDEYGLNNGFDFQHAEKGGEFFVKNVGCFLDGYDALRNVAIEFYERFHYDISGNLKEKDVRRENAIISKLNCSFIRINAFDKNNLKYEIIK